MVCPLIVGVICAIICGIIANSKGRSVGGWAALGFFFGLIPLIIVACLPNLNEQTQRDAYIDQENRRLREQLRQERIKSEAFRQHASARLDAHDQHLGLDTKQASQALGVGTQTAEQLGGGAEGTLDPAQPGAGGENTPRWYYGREGRTLGPVKSSEISELIRLQIISRETLLWCETMADWQPARQVAVFAESFV